MFLHIYIYIMMSLTVLEDSEQWHVKLNFLFW